MDTFCNYGLKCGKEIKTKSSRFLWLLQFTFPYISTNLYDIMLLGDFFLRMKIF